MTSITEINITNMNISLLLLLRFLYKAGNDPTYRGTDHTREQVPLIIYSKQFNEMKVLNDGDSFGIIGSTICDNFNVKYNGIGSSILELLK